MSLKDRLSKTSSSSNAEDVAKALGLSSSGLQSTVPRISSTSIFQKDAIERALSGKPKKKEERVDIKNIDVGSNSSEESELSDSEDSEDIPDDEGMDELLAEMQPMGGDSDEEQDMDEAMAEMEEDLDEDEREELGDDADEDEEEEQEETTSDSKKTRSGPAETQEGRLEQEKRTICVTNVAVTTKKKKLMSLFKKYGPVESIRFRNVSFARGGNKQVKKRLWIQKEFHPERDSMSAYVRFETIEACRKALGANCTEVNGKHIFVDISVGSNRDRANSVFVGNLPAGAEEEDLYEIFTTQVGPVDYIRIVRDQEFKIGKGFAYAKFRNDKDMKKCLELNGKINYKDRVLRLQQAITNQKTLENLKTKVAYFKRQRTKRKPEELEAKYKKYQSQAKKRKMN